MSAMAVERSENYQQNVVRSVIFRATARSFVTISFCS